MVEARISDGDLTALLYHQMMPSPADIRTNPNEQALVSLKQRLKHLAASALRRSVSG
jgi:hypothetical protein